MPNIINPIEAKMDDYSRKIEKLSVYAKHQVELNVTDPDGPFASLFVDWVSIYSNTQELTAKQLFLEYVGAVHKKDRMLLDEFVVSYLKMLGIITEVVEERAITINETSSSCSHYSKQSQIYIPFSYYIDNKEFYSKDRYKLTVDELYFKYKELLSQSDCFVQAYADSVVRSHEFLDSHDVTIPYAYLIVQKLSNGNYLVMNNPRG